MTAEQVGLAHTGGEHVDALETQEVRSRPEANPRPASTRPIFLRRAFVLFATDPPQPKARRAALRIRADPASIEPQYLLWLLQTRLGDLRSDQDGQRRIDPDLVARLELAWPPRHEQRHHAELLDRVNTPRDRLHGRKRSSRANLSGALITASDPA